MKRAREDELAEELESVKAEISALKAEKAEWKAKAEIAEREGEKAEAKEHLGRYDTVNTQLASLQQQLFLAKSALDDERRQKREKISAADWTRRLPAPIPTPSNASAQSLDGKLIVASAAIHEVAFESLKTLVDRSIMVESPFLEAGSGFLNLLRRFESKEAFGLFKDGLIRGEIAHTSVATEFLGRHFSEQNGVFLHWMHQLQDPSSGKMDIGLYASETCDGPMAPVAVIEAGFKGASKKRWQAAAYAVNVASQCKDDTRALLSVELGLDQAGGPPHLSLRCYSPPSETECEIGRSGLWTTTVWKGEGSQDALARMLKVLMHGAHLAVVERERLFARIGVNVGCSKERRVFKFYDYRYHDPSVGDTDRRSYDMCLRFVKGAEVALSDDNLAVISYPFIEGEHYACSVRQIIDVAKNLKRLHDEGVCHGDIRASNMVFCGDGGSCLIDFDFAGESGSKKYPTGYSHEIDDAKRHERATEGGRLAKEHDTFALASVMEFHTCDEAGAEWKAVIELVRKNKLDDGIEKMKNISDKRLKPNKVLHNLSQGGTGSPARK